MKKSTDLLVNFKIINIKTYMFTVITTFGIVDSVVFCTPIEYLIVKLYSLSETYLIDLLNKGFLQPSQVVRGR